MQIDFRELATRWAEALASATSGGEVIVMDGPTPQARLLPLGATTRVAGLHAGAIQATPDFDAPLPDDFWSGQT